MIRNQLPNAITLLNLTAGCMMMACITIDANEWVLVWLVIGLSADFLDGALARWLGATSALGAQLDSLADLVTFGLAPTFVLFFWFLDGTNDESFFHILDDGLIIHSYLFGYPVSSVQSAS